MERSIEIQGVQVPRIGLGTWDLSGAEAERAVESALELGYRHIDTAEMYRNESEIGRALRRASIPREELFLVSKVWSNHLRAEQVIEAGRHSLERLRCEYLDLYLIHWPSDAVPIEATMEGMDALVDEGTVKRIGVSNFSVSQLERASEVAQHSLLTNQVRFNPRYRQDEMVEFCNQEGILLTAYTPLAKAHLTREPILQEIAEKHDKTPLQVALRWLLQQGNVSAIPKSSQRQHLKENLAVFDFVLDADDLARIDGRH